MPKSPIRTDCPLVPKFVSTHLVVQLFSNALAGPSPAGLAPPGFVAVVVSYIKVLVAFLSLKIDKDNTLLTPLSWVTTSFIYLIPTIYWVGVGVDVGVFVGVGVGLFVGVFVGVGVGLFVGVSVGVGAKVAEGNGVFVGVKVGVGVGIVVS